MSRSLPTLLFILVLVPRLQAQTLAQRVGAVAEGTVRLSFAARAGVCGDWADGVNTRQDTYEWRAECERGPVRVAVQVRDHRVQSVRTYVGGQWLPDPGSTDLGTVGARQAADYFIGLAERDDVAGDPLLPPVLADSVTIWPSLVRLARTPHIPKDIRTRAVFWLSQAAGVAAGRALDSIARDDRGDREIRKQAIFALSQRSPEEGVPALIRIARGNPDPELRKSALFWLGQTEDPRALALFEEILR